MPQRDNLVDEIQKADILLEYAVLHGEMDDAERLRTKPRKLAAIDATSECQTVWNGRN